MTEFIRMQNAFDLDEQFRRIGDDEPYDKAEYFVVRKLYVELEPASSVS